jgi:hypothetical protein
MTYGTAEYIRIHVWEEKPGYTFPKCENGHPGCSCTNLAGGKCIEDVEAECNDRVYVLAASKVIDAILNEGV